MTRTAIARNKLYHRGLESGPAFVYDQRREDALLSLAGMAQDVREDPDP